MRLTASQWQELSPEALADFARELNLWKEERHCNQVNLSLLLEISPTNLSYLLRGQPISYARLKIAKKKFAKLVGLPAPEPEQGVDLGGKDLVVYYASRRKQKRRPTDEVKLPDRLRECFDGIRQRDSIWPDRIALELNTHAERTDRDFEKMKRVADCLRALMKAYGITQAGMARLIGVSSTDVSSILCERPQSRLRFSLIYQGLMKMGVIHV